MAQALTLFEKIWNSHLVTDLGDGLVLIHIDRHFLQETTSAPAFNGLREKGLKVRNPNLTFATQDHIMSTKPGRKDDTYPEALEFIEALRRNTKEFGIELFDLDDPRQGIVHVIAPDLGIALPGCTLVCGDSHTSTSGGVGALSWGIGTSEVEHVLATQTIVQRKPKTMRVNFDGTMGRGVSAKDLILYLIGKIGIGAGTGHAVEYAGSAIRTLSIEGRLTICNLSIEFGARSGMVAPDEKTFAYLAGRPFVPTGDVWKAAVDNWRYLQSDPDAGFDREVSIDVNEIKPQVTWGNSPQDVIAIDERVPDPSKILELNRRQSMERALHYMGLKPGMPIEGLKVDVVFIGSCTNSRLSDLEEAARIVRGRKVAKGVRALVVPGSGLIKHAAEEKGLDRIFLDAGFEWREPGCSMCVAVNDDRLDPEKRSVSTSNRNFEGRQGRDSRTHLASPQMAAAAAIAGCITDVRKMEP
jgi:3-isopropylmalate/(R)-2-methylmalate dehydratase large subunit